MNSIKHARDLPALIAVAIGATMNLQAGMASAQAIDRPGGVGSATNARLMLSASCDPATDARAAAAQAAGEQGKTRLRFHVSAQGALERAEVVSSSGWQRLDRIALAALSRCPMQPARNAQGQAVAGSTVVEYVWRVD